MDDTREPDEDWEAEPPFGPPLVRVTSKAIQVKLSRAQYDYITEHENITFYHAEDGEVVGVVIDLDDDDD